jgi:hypothetical protein
MRGAELQDLVRRLHNGDNAAQNLAWELYRADEAEVLRLIEDNATIVAEYSPTQPVEDDHPNLFPTS